MATDTKEKKYPISGNLAENEKFFIEHAGLNTTFDIGIRKLQILDFQVNMYFLNGLCDTKYITEILKKITSISDDEVDHIKFKEILENRIVNQSVSKVFKSNPEYYHWIMKSNFPIHTKKKFTEIKLKKINK